MKQHRLRSLCCVLLCLLLLCPLLPASADAEAIPDMSVAKSVYFYHIESDSVVLAQNEDTLVPAASTVKILSGLLFCEKLSERLDETVTVTEDMIADAKGYRSNFIKVGTRMTVRDLLYCAICASYNDAYLILAHLVANNPQEFIALMANRADELGATQSNFNDLVGTADSSFTTAKEMALIAKAAYQNLLYMQICGEDEYKITSLVETIINRNEMIKANQTNKHYNKKCTGMNAGSTASGGDCVVASATNGQESYLCIVLGCKESDTVIDNQAYILANNLINWVYRTYVYLDIITPETVVCTIPVSVSDMTSEIEVKSDQTLSYYLPATATVGKEIQYSIRLTQTELEAPVEEGMFVGYVAVLYQNEIIGTVPLYTAGSADRSGFVSNLKIIQSLTKNRPFIAGAIFFLIVLTAWIVTEAIIQRQRHRRWDKYFSNKIDTTKRRK